MPIDPELLAEAQRRGIPAPAAKPVIDPELLAEAQRRGIAPPAAPNASSLMDKLAGYGKAAARLSSPPTAMLEDIMEPGKAVDRWKAGFDGLRQKETASQDPEAQALNVAGRYGAGIAATAAFPPAGAADLAGIAALRYAPALGRAGFTAARLAAAAASAGTTAGLGTLAASTVAGAPAPAESLQAGKDYAAGELAAPAIGKVAGGIWKGGKWIAGNALEKTTNLISGTTPAAWNTLREAGDKVAGYAREGMTTDLENKPIARAIEKAKALAQAAKEEAQGFARSAQGRIKDVTEGAGKNYRSMMDYLHQDVSGVKFDAAGPVYDKMEPYIQQNATLRGTDAGEGATKKLLDVYDGIKHSLAEGMTPGEAADHLQRITAIQRDNAGKAVSAHARELKGYLMDALPGEYRIPTIDTPTPEGISIGDIRNEYRVAKETERGIKKFTNAENPQNALERALVSGGKTGEAIKAAMGPKGIPGFAGDVASMRGAEAAAQPEINAAKAGAQFAPTFTNNLPRTGLTAGLISSLAKVAGGSVTAIAAVPLEILGMSPRLAMETRLAAGKGAGALEKFVADNASKLPPVLANALRAAREKK